MPARVLAVNDDSFETEVLHSRIPVLVSFWAEWCGPCKTMVATLAEVADLGAGDIKVCSMNVDENPEMAQVYRVRGVPTLIIFKNGDSLATKVGALDSSKLTAFVRSNL